MGPVRSAIGVAEWADPHRNPLAGNKSPGAEQIVCVRDVPVAVRPSPVKAVKEQFAGQKGEVADLI